MTAFEVASLDHVASGVEIGNLDIVEKDFTRLRTKPEVHRAVVRVEAGSEFETDLPSTPA